MASPLPNIPAEFLNPRQKYALMNYLVDLGLPARILRETLQAWGEAVGVDLTPGDYELLENHLRTVSSARQP